MHQRLFLLVAVAFLAGCESSPTDTSVARSSSSGERFAQNPNDRPGLGTKWGEDRRSRVGLLDFKRDPGSPHVTATIYYNDRRGIAAMSHLSTLNRKAFDVLEDYPATSVTIGIQDEDGRFLPAAEAFGQHYVVGTEGQRYRIFFRNGNERRVEAVFSVDGLDVIDGKRASLQKRGYIVGPHQKLVIEGFRRSMETVAAFRFGPVRESYVNEKYHRTTNVGVIGLAVFEEQSPENPRVQTEAGRRLKARPFAEPVR
jgi:hypothetical protein